MAVMITGGSGLLGSWLAREFSANGEEVISLDTVHKEFDYLNGISGRVSFVRASVLDFPRLVQVCRQYGGRISGVIHTVALMAGPSFVENPHEGVSLNIQGSLNMLELCRIFEIEKYLYVSSGAVYGEVDRDAAEDTHHMHPGDLYGASKAAAELIGEQYANHYGIDYRCVRPYFFFGPGRLPSEQTHLFKNLLGPLQGLRDLRLEKGADQKLGFTYVKDVSRGTYLLYTAAAPRHRTVNIASDEAVAFTEMVRLAKQFSSRPTEVYLGPGKLLPRGELLDISVARRELGFEPEYGVERAMKEYAEWVRKNAP
jgi:nucleoside-diphosphate-sugar epimerase